MAKSNEQGPTFPIPPYKDPVELFSQLPPHVRKFLESLDEEEVSDLIELLKNYRRSKTVGWFFKGIIVLGATSFMATVGVLEAASKFKSWIGWN